MYVGLSLPIWNILPVEENTLSCSICPQVLNSDTFMWRSTCRGVRSGIILHYLVVCRSHVPVGRTKKNLCIILADRRYHSLSLSCIHVIRHSLQNRATCLSFVLARFLVSYTLISIRPSGFLLVVQLDTSDRLTLILPLQYANDTIVMDTNSATYREIQIECKRLGLKAAGTREELIKCLESSTSHQQNSFTQQNREDTEFQPSHVDGAEIHEGGKIHEEDEIHEECEIHEEGIPELATISLVPVIQERRGDLEGEISDRLVERRRGPRVDLATLVESAYKTLAVSRRECELQAKELAENQLRLDSLEESVGRMTASMGTYRFLRNRFLSTFKRDKLGTATKFDLSIIAGGKSVPDGGDAATDAMLYQGTRGRRDTVTFRKLYGLEPETVLKIRKSSCYL